jgi:hypothetical protein
MKELESIREYTEKEIIELAKKTFEDMLKNDLLTVTSSCSNEGYVYIAYEKKKEWYINFKRILESSKSYSQYYNINSDDVFDFLIKHIRSNPVFNGVALNPDFINGKIYFSWSLSSKDMSITKELHKLFEEKRTVIINDSKSEFNNLLREEMKVAAKKGVRKGNFYFENSGNFCLLKNILNTTDKITNTDYDVYKDYDVCKWLLNNTLNEQKDLTGIKIDVEKIPLKVYFSW